jgi:hypothetical protein
MNNSFVIASKKKLRFITNKGQIATEDLWDLSLEALDTIAVSLDEKLQNTRKSFIGRREKAAEDELRFDIIKTVIETKVDEADKAKTRASRRADREFLQRLLDQKKVQELEGLNVDEIQKRLSELSEEGTEE